MTDQNTDMMRNRLVAWYAHHHRPLPWRNTSDPYRIWVSEVMLQQTQVKTVVPYYQAFLSHFPTVEDLARSDLVAVLKVWEGLGYYARARNLFKAAKMVAENSGGKVPSQWEAFRRLPGVGEYIASAVLSIAFGCSHAVVDGNVKRLLARLLLIDDPVNSARSHRIYKQAATEFLDEVDPGLFNQAMMELGALVCRPRAPACDVCCLQEYCRAFRTDSVAKYPKRELRKPVPTRHIAAGVVRKNGKVLITQRKPEGLLGGLWEFPGGKVMNGEDARSACIREIREETGLVTEIEEHLTRVKHAYTHFRIEMDVFFCRYVSGRVRLSGPEAFRWIRVEDLSQYPFPKANRKFIPLLQKQSGK